MIRQKLCFVTVAFLLALPAAAWGQKGPEPKPEKAEAEKKVDDQPEAKPEGEGAEQPAPPMKKKSSHRAYTSKAFEMENMSDIEIKNYGQIAKIREDSIKKMVDLIESTPNYPNFADVCYRIAEYMTENIKYRIAVQAKQYRKDMERFRAGQMDEEPQPPSKDYSRSLPFYEKILMEHPNYQRVEEVLFYLGRNGVETGRSTADDKLVEKSVKYLNKLEEMFPQSRFLPQAHLMAAEYFFHKNNLFEALKYYKKLVEKHKDSPMYLYALYKQGWVYYNYQQYDKTQVAYEEVIQTLRERGKPNDTLRDMTLKDYLITVSEAGEGWTGARDFLKQEIGDVEAYKTLHGLAKMLKQHGFYDDAVTLNQHFISLDQNSPKVVEYWNAILNIYRFNFPFEEIEKQVRQLRFFFRNDGPWMGNNKADAKTLERAQDLRIKWDLSLAEFYLEEGLYRQGGEEKFLLAIRRAEEVLEKGAGSRTEQAWAGIMLARQGLFRMESDGRIINQAENVQGPAYPDDYKLPKKLRRMKLTKNEGAYMAALAKYMALPDRKGQKPDLMPLASVEMEPNLLYHAALVHYVKGMNEEGLKNIDDLLAFSAASPYAGWAGDMTYQMSARAEDFVGLQKRTKAMLDAKNVEITPEGQLREYYCSGLIGEGQQLSKKGQGADAMECISRAGQTCTDNVNKAGEAYYFLGEAAEKAGFFDQAKAAYKKVLDEYSKSKYRSMASRGFKRVKGK
jgi:tetratricopeptide (TPR) repeat protein